MTGPTHPLAMVVAMNADRVIGVDGDLPWRIREDLRHFRRVTMGHAIIMGRKTWDSIGRPLPGRRNIVVSRNRELKIEGAEVIHGLAQAIGAAIQGGDDEPRVIGGSTLYEAALPLTTRLFITEVDRSVEGDTFFPEFDRREWREVSRQAGETEGVVFTELERI